MNAISVLIIDDNEADRYLFTCKLNKTSLVSYVFECEDGREAIEFFENTTKNQICHPEDYPPAILFLDLNMPRMTGHEFLTAFKTLREKLALEPIVIMMFSSSTLQSDIDDSLQHEFVQDYLIKGEFSVDELKQKIQSHINNT
jgi:CheY-like chemotaxis protein